MNDDEFLNDRDCTPKGETPRTDGLDRDMQASELSDRKKMSVALTLAKDLERELARALRIVEAARKYKNDDSHDDTASLNAMLNAVEEWEAGR